MELREEALSAELNGLAEQVVASLKEQGKQIALAESCTGGLLAKTITDVSGASNVFECGVVSYSSRIKAKVLGVDPQVIDKHTVVSEPVAVQMARGVRALGEADLGIGVTGVAGPGPDGDHPEGEIFVAVTDGTADAVTHLQTGTTDKRTENRYTAAITALNTVLELIARDDKS